LDELGRGTATTDGAAIASAALDHLSRGVRCRGVFATHYHRVADERAADAAVALKHMACAVTPSAEPGGVDDVAFLYRLTAGACPKSYGVNVARLAGLPEGVVRRAAAASREAEAAGRRQRAARGGRDQDQELDEAGGGGGEEDAGLEALRARVLEACSLAEAGGPEAAGRLAAAREEVCAALGA
jgi:DNA mismatch repair protein MSH6